MHHCLAARQTPRASKEPIPVHTDTSQGCRQEERVNRRSRAGRYFAQDNADSRANYTAAGSGMPALSGRETVMQIMCRELHADEVEQEVTQRDQFNTDEVNLTATLIRESHQNSADARGKSNAAGPVTTRIRLVEPLPSNRDYFAGLFSGLAPHIDASGIDSSEFDLGMPRILLIEDFGTTGLTGDFMVKADRGPFNNFWRRVGRSDKGGAKGGRWGLGKLVFSSASQIHTFFGLTVRESETDRRWLMGQAVLATRKVGGRDYAPHVFFAEPGEGGLQLPCGSAAEVDAFAAAIGITRGSEPGLSIAIPFVRSDITIKNLIPEVLKNYFFPILTGRLAVEIGDETINEETFDDVATRYSWQDTGSNAQLLDFIREIRAVAGGEPDAVMGPGWPAAIEASLPADVLEMLRQKIAAQNGMVHVRAPVTLRHKDTARGTMPTYVDLYLRRTSDQSRGGALYVRGEITVPDEARYFTPRQTLAALVAKDGPVVSFLGDAENPAHTRWNGNADKLRDWLAPSARLSEIRSSLGKLQNLLLQAVDTLEKDALKDIFDVKDEAAKKTDRPTLRPDQIKPPVPPLPGSKSLFSIREQAGGFAVRSAAGLTEDRLPLVLNVSIAYDVQRGDPFAKFSPFDFDLNRPELTLQADGAACAVTAANQFTIECTGKKFTVTCSGLDPHRDVIVKAVKAS